MSGLEAALAEVAGRLEERGFPYMVIGGMANLQWGEPRTTQDLDKSRELSRPEIADRYREAKSTAGSPKA